ncbi:hypothetical protein [Mesorhizobium sp. NPDC059025]|uniref:hypothetical protein n=1 Tax=unclassified Mesorhizobium TaxID=325217 RepID=UPI00369244F3
MYFLQFLAGMTVTFIATFGWFYVSGGSLRQALGFAVLATWIIQTAYFLAVVLMIRSSSKSEPCVQPCPPLDSTKAIAQRERVVVPQGSGEGATAGAQGRAASSQAPRV